MKIIKAKYKAKLAAIKRPASIGVIGGGESGISAASSAMA